MVETKESSAHLERLRRLVSERLGLRFASEQLGDLERGLLRAAGRPGCQGLEDIEKWLSQPPSPEQAKALARHLTVGETYFFREPRHFEYLTRRIVPEILAGDRAGRPLRIWSAGCASGEEPYSIAIRIHERFPGLPISILATDINPDALDRARTGVYRSWSFRTAVAGEIERYFTPEQDLFRIVPAFRRAVDFEYMNLAEDVYPSLPTRTNGLDVIFCRNVLMYFELSLVRTVVERFHRCLAPGGWLIASTLEVPPDTELFDTLGLPDTVVHRRKDPVAPPRPFPRVPPENDEPGLPPDMADAARNPHADRQISRSENAAEPARHLREPGVALGEARRAANLGRLDAAGRWCLEAIAADPLAPSPYYLLATIRQELGDLEGAARILRQAIYAAPDFVLAHYAMGNVTARLGRGADAHRHFRNALRFCEQFPSGTALHEGEGLTAGRLAEVIRRRGASFDAAR